MGQQPSHASWAISCCLQAFSCPLPSPGPELALQLEKVAQEESAHCILVPQARGHTASVNRAPNTCCLLGPWASGRWGSRRWTDLETVQAMVWKFLERPSQLEQITFLNCLSSEERVGGFLVFEFVIFLFGSSLEMTIALPTPLWPVRRHRWRMNFASLGKYSTGGFFIGVLCVFLWCLVCCLWAGSVNFIHFLPAAPLPCMAYF